MLLRWGLQQGCCVIPKSVHPEYLQQYAEEQLLGWTLTDAQMKLLTDLDDDHKYCWDASGVL